MRTADVTGAYGEAWDGTGLHGERPEQEASVAAWFVHLPAAHPLWPKYVISTVHLRDEPGLPTPVKDYPGAEYEFLVLALNPDANPTPDDPKTWDFLLPINVRVQFDGCDDEWARLVTALAVHATVDGDLHVETDDYVGATQAWEEVIRQTAQHQHLPHHGMDN